MEDNELRSDANFQWVQVTNEIKNRQKVAKVKPRLDPSRQPSKSTNHSASSTVDSQSASTVTNGSTNHRSWSTRSGDSNYAQLSEFSADFLLSPDRGSGGGSTTTADEDSVSLAGTVFNEPWDSSAWENLLNLGE